MCSFIITYGNNRTEFTSVTSKHLLNGTSFFVVLRRTVFTFLSGVYVYVIAWALLGQDSGDSLGPKNLSDFTVGTSVFLL